MKDHFTLIRPSNEKILLNLIGQKRCNSREILCVEWGIQNSRASVCSSGSKKMALVNQIKILQGLVFTK